MTAFWILAPIMVMAALGLLFVRKAVHAAMLLAIVMLSLSVLYLVLDAPFLFATQIIVYTGAILMLFLFVLMLVGVDASDSVVETIRGQRCIAVPLGGLVLGAIFVIGVIAHANLGTSVPGTDVGEREGRRQHRGARRHPLLALRLRLRGHLGAADHRRGRRDGARPPRAAHAEADPGRPGRQAGPRLRRLGQAPRPAADAGRLRPSQRGRHSRTAARRHRPPRPPSRGSCAGRGHGPRGSAGRRDGIEPEMGRAAVTTPRPTAGDEDARGRAANVSANRAPPHEPRTTSTSPVDPVHDRRASAS